MENPVVFSNVVQNVTYTTDIRDVTDDGFYLRVRNFHGNADAYVTTGTLVHWFAVNKITNDRSKIYADSIDGTYDNG